MRARWPLPLKNSTKLAGQSFEQARSDPAAFHVAAHSNAIITHLQAELISLSEVSETNGGCSRHVI